MRERMKRLYIITFVILCAGLIASLHLNVHLFHQSKSFYIQLQDVRLDPMGRKTYGGAPNQTKEEPLTVVLAGDSRAADWPSPDDIQECIFVNRGIGNQTTAQILGRLHEDVLSLKPNIVIIQAGVNDLKTIPLFPNRKRSIVLNCKTNIQRIVSQCTDRNARVIISTIFPVGKPSLQRRPFWSPEVSHSIREVNSFLRSLSSDKVVILDSFAVLSGDHDLIKSEYSSDTLHLNASGYNSLNKELVKILQKINGTAQQDIKKVLPEGTPSDKPSI